MKAKTMLGLVACASACVASVNVFAADLLWFNGNVSSTTTSAISSPSYAAWTVPETGVETADQVITLDNDKDTALVLTPTPSSEPVLSDGVVTISSRAVLTPSDAGDLASMTITGAKAGFAAGVWDDSGVAKTNFFGYTSDGWVKLAGAVVPDGTATDFKIVLDYRTGKKTVEYYVGPTQLYTFGYANSNQWALADTTATSLANVAAYGSGSLSALSATCEQAVAAATVNDVTVKYGTVAEAIAAAGQNGTVKDIDANGDATATPQAANGLAKWECAALGIEEAATIPLVPAETVNGKVTVAFGGTVMDDVNATFTVTTVSGTEAPTGPFPANAIQLPMGTGKYTVTPVIKAASN